MFFPCFLEPACCINEGRNSDQLVASTEQRPDFCVASYGQQGSRSRVIAIKDNILKTWYDSKRRMHPCILGIIIFT
ncbi:MAG: hypothetical protein ACI4LY_04890, partial [Candidatus Fimisoma sp.]